MQITTWSTNDVEPRHRASYWRDVISRAVLGGSVDMLEPGFAGCISARRLHRLAFASFDSSAHDILREKRDIARDTTGSFLLSLQLAGTAKLRQGGREAELRTGQMGILDSTKPFVVSFTGTVRRMVAVLPRDLVRRYAPVLGEASAPLLIDNSAPCADLVREYVTRLSNPAFEVSEIAAEVLSENLCSLLGIVSSGSAGARGAPAERDLRLESLLAYMRRHATNPELTPGDAAAHLKISVRSIHKLMRETGRTFCAWLLDERIDQCIRRLRSPQYARQRISEIAWDCGFSDVSYFNGVFKQRVGMTPSSLRHSATGATEAATQPAQSITS
ncbi:MAG TPA: helix-turn-helix domain-containing protein [Steroidobacteraceae bacterium]|nr:helix-turn-helix domain-containing protein [Steroidobacteraceae bacterium]